MRKAIVVQRKDKVAAAYRYHKWVYRVVEIEEGQSGYLSERGVVLIHQTAGCTYRGGPKDRAARAEAERIAAAVNRRLSAGFQWDTADGIVTDYLSERTCQ